MKKLLMIAAIMLLSAPLLHAQYVLASSQHERKIECWYSDENATSLAHITSMSVEQPIDLEKLQTDNGASRSLILQINKLKMGDEKVYETIEMTIDRNTRLSSGPKYGLRIIDDYGNNQWLYLPDECRDRMYAFINCISPILDKDDSRDAEELISKNYGNHGKVCCLQQAFYLFGINNLVIL